MNRVSKISLLIVKETKIILRIMDYKSAPFVSIIIPVYNAEKYLRQCLDSVVNQTMREIQIICVNDGSTDHSLAVLQEYTAKDERIEIIDKPNGGAAAARNAAYSHIRGKYTLFVDADDWIELDCCEKVCQKSESTRAPLTVFLYQGEEGQSTPSQSRYFSSDNKMTVEEKIPFFDYLVWNKLWRTDFLLDNKIFFPEGLIFEDSFVNWMSVTLADKISVIPERFYHYRYTPGSVMQTRIKHWRHVILIYNKIYNYLMESGNYTDYRNIFISRKLHEWHFFYHYLPSSLRSQFAAMIRENLNTDDREFLRTSPKKLVSKEMRLFYEMIDGGIIETVNYKIIFPLREYAKIPERVLRQRVFKPLIKRLKAA